MTNDTDMQGMALELCNFIARQKGHAPLELPASFAPLELQRLAVAGVPPIIPLKSVLRKALALGWITKDPSNGKTTLALTDGYFLDTPIGMFYALLVRHVKESAAPVDYRSLVYSSPELNKSLLAIQAVKRLIATDSRLIITNRGVRYVNEN